MRPDREEMLAGMRRALVEFVAPEVTSVYGRTELNYAINLLAVIARESEDVVANLVAEDAALRRLLRYAGRRLAGSSLSGSPLVAELLAVSPPPRKPDLRLSALRAESRLLLDLFVRLQAACEEVSEDRAAPAVYAKTLAFLRRRAEAQAGAPMRAAGAPA
jgi:hypothetical protein